MKLEVRFSVSQPWPDCKPADAIPSLAGEPVSPYYQYVGAERGVAQR